MVKKGDKYEDLCLHMFSHSPSESVKTGQTGDSELKYIKQQLSLSIITAPLATL